MQQGRQFIQGPAGQLETDISIPPNWQPGMPVAVCCHPHPLHGGTMQNKVVHILAKTFNALGAVAVRFNFRGVGKSEGEFDHGQGEGEDLRAVVDFIKAQSGDSPLWLAGFSFGAFVALRMHGQLHPARLLLVAPPINLYSEITTIKVVTNDWLLVQGGGDDVVPAELVRRWGNTQANNPSLIWDDEAGHFFHGKLTWLQDQILQYWQ